MRIAALLALCAVASPAWAGGNTSAYTKLDLAACKQVDAPIEDQGYSGAYLCDGYGGTKVYWTGGDLRVSLAFGAAPEKHCAAMQTFSAFNDEQPTIEWRLRDGKPFAVIQRWKVSVDPDAPDKRKDWLVVTRLEPENSCHMALVEGAMPDANQRARDEADTHAGSFACMKDTARIILAKPAPDSSALITGSCTPP